MPLPLPYAIQNVFFPNTPSCLHSNGLGQFYDDCAHPLGVPGNPATYNLTMAMGAGQAWMSGDTGTVSLICGTGEALGIHTANQMAVWMYSGPLAGHVHLNATGLTAFCPTATDPTWNYRSPRPKAEAPVFVAPGPGRRAGRGRLALELLGELLHRRLSQHVGGVGHVVRPRRGALVAALVASPAFWASMTALSVVACIVIACSTAAAGRFSFTEFIVVPNVLA